MFKPQNKVQIRWSPQFAYAIGLITSDGNLSSDGRHISLKSVDEELILHFKSALKLVNKAGKSVRGGGHARKYFNLQFGDVIFYDYLQSIGIAPAKSKIIKRVGVPEKFFADFLRGLFDGDGTFYTFWDKRWPSSFAYQIAFSSASLDFVIWLKNKLSNLYGVNGFLRHGRGVYNLRFVKGDTRKLFSAMYYRPNLLYLSRKYHKITKAFSFDRELALKRSHNRSKMPR